MVVIVVMRRTWMMIPGPKQTLNPRALRLRPFGWFDGVSNSRVREGVLILVLGIRVNRQGPLTEPTTDNGSCGTSANRSGWTVWSLDWRVLTGYENAAHEHGTRARRANDASG
eukprot:3959641-Prymnesium_polylepis.1